MYQVETTPYDSENASKYSYDNEETDKHISYNISENFCQNYQGEIEPNRNAEAYRNFQPPLVPGQVDKHLDFIDICDDGFMLLGCSNLSGRFWSGSLWYFMDPGAAPDIEQCLTGIACESGVCDGKFLEDSQRIIVGQDPGAVQIYSLVEDSDEHSFHFSSLGYACEHDDCVNTISVFEDKKKAISGSFDGNIKVWDIESLVAEHTLRPAHLHQVTCVSAHPNNNSMFASTSLDSSALLWDTKNTRPASVLLRDVSMTSATWHPVKEELVYIGSVGGDIAVLDIRQTKAKLSVFTSFKRAIHKMKFSKSVSSLLAVCADDAVVKMIDCEDPINCKAVYSDIRHKDFVRGLAWSPKSNILYSCGWDTKIFSHVPGSVSDMEVNGAT